MKILLPVLFVLTFGCTIKNLEREVKVAHGSIVSIVDFKSSYVEPRNIDIWLPDNYNTNTEYQVLYMHDGQMLFDSTTTWNHQEWGIDETMGRMIASKEIPPTIVVGIWNPGGGRHSNYFPQKPFEQLPKAFQDSLYNVNGHSDTALFPYEVNSDNYLRFITQELKPYIDQTYSTLSDQQHTFIGGSSMGGLISMYAICEYPDIFGGAACISTHWPGVFPKGNNPIPQLFADYLNQDLPNPINHRFYFDYGTETLDKEYEVHQLVIDSIMTTHDYTDSNWVTKKYEGHDHSERSWRLRMDVVVGFLLGETDMRKE